MTDEQVPQWPWWMAPARLLGRYRPALLAATHADAIALRALPRAAVSVVLPLAVVVLAGFVATLHATTVLPHVSPHIDWLRFQMDDVFTEAPAFMLCAIAIGAFSPALGALLVAVFGVMDLGASAIQKDELQPLPAGLAARLVADWLLWLLIVEIPVLGRVLASSIRGLAASRLAVAALNGIVTGGFTLLWTQGAAILVRPVFEWSSVPGGRVEAYQPMQVGGMVFAVAAGALAAAVAFVRGPGRLLFVSARPSRPMQASQGPRALAVTAMRRLIVAALLTIGLGGMITEPLDAAVLFVALAGAGPLARLIADWSPIGLVLDRLPPILRVAIALPLVYVVSFSLIYAGGLKAISEFFSVIVVFAVGLFVIELVTVRGSGRSGARRSLARAAGMGTALGLALFAIAGVAPSAVFADNGTSLVDLWPAFDIAVFAGMATPFILWAAKRNQPPLTWDEPTPRPSIYDPGPELTFGTPRRVTPKATPKAKDQPRPPDRRGPEL